MIQSPLKVRLDRQVITPFFYFLLSSVAGETAIVMITKKKKKQKSRVSVSRTSQSLNSYQDPQWLVTMQLSKLDCEILFRLPRNTIITFTWSSVVEHSDCGAFEGSKVKFVFDQQP